MLQKLCHPIWPGCGADPGVHRRDWVPAHQQHILSTLACLSPLWLCREEDRARTCAGLFSSASCLGRDVSFLSVLWVPLVFQALLQRGLCQHQTSAVEELFCWSVQAPCISDMLLRETSAWQLWDQMSPCRLDNIRLWVFSLDGSKIIPAFFKSWTQAESVGSKNSRVCRGDSTQTQV